MAARVRRRAASARPSSLRLIGGAWRSRAVAIGDTPGLRPTPARVRETLFNWLAPRIAGARCIDLFAGTGALGLEALSRGAAQVCFIEQNPAAAQAIRDALARLGGTDRASVETGNAIERVTAHHSADVVFIDPPFAAGLQSAALVAVAPVLAPGARLYIEFPAASRADMERTLDPGFEILRIKQAGNVGYCLARAAQDSEYSAP